jgi:hypothetical protein
MQSHIKAVGYIYIVLGVLCLIGAVCILGVGGVAGFSGAAGAAGSGEDAAAAMLGGGIMAAIGVFVAILSIPSFLAGWGVLKLKPWARILTIVLACINLLSIPIGTIIGAYALWVMFNDETKRIFEGGAPVVQTY